MGAGPTPDDVAIIVRVRLFASSAALEIAIPDRFGHQPISTLSFAANVKCDRQNVLDAFSVGSWWRLMGGRHLVRRQSLPRLANSSRDDVGGEPGWFMLGTLGAISCLIALVRLAYHLAGH